ncbi:hypothetical protein LT330_000273 [Penicillium expansum]|uniref:Mid2-like cell wall stress sensor n=1 Tax=Penicillium expansum TaxID=27334 RepID=A0A0A2JP56_PENEN|nr:hypothetical protein PEX2_080450 [Penicillium expansum]KAK4871036.1 hypothetical protein LT330_000273 [Penicillium expansum]KGO56438.1 hypothetical protein PEX2_080450 [Penicillium expansum]
MQLSIFALCTVLCSRVLGHPYTSETTSWISATTTSVEDLWAVSKPTEAAHLYGKRGYDVILQARDTTTTTDSTTSTDTTSDTTTTDATTTDTTTSETSTSTTSTTSTTATSTSETSTSSSTSSTSTTTTSATSTSATSSSTTSTSTTSTTSSSTTTSSASTTTSTATATATSSSTAELDEWNRRGNIAAIVFGCCMISLFGGLSLLYCLRNKARARRIAARKELESSQSYSKIPLVAAKHNSATDLELNRSSMMFTNKPDTEYFPARSDPSVSNYHGHSHNTSTTSQTTAGQSSTRSQTPRAYSNEQHMPLV